MKEYYSSNDNYNIPTENITESIRMKIHNKVILTLLKDSSRDLFKKLILCEESIRKKIITIIIQKYLNISSDEEIDAIIKDINHTSERGDGSSDGLYEALDIILDDGYRECSNRNLDLQQIGTLKQLFPDKIELTPDDEFELFTRIQEALFPGKNKLTGKEQLDVYNRMKEFLEEMDSLINNLI